MVRDEKREAREAEHERRDALRRESFVPGTLNQLVKVLPLPGYEDWQSQDPEVRRRNENAGVTGYVTVERYLLGMTADEIETALGLKVGSLKAGCRVFAVQQQPGPSVITHELTADYPDGLAFTVLSSDEYPPGDRRIHQWKLHVCVQAKLICILRPGTPYRSTVTP